MKKDTCQLNQRSVQTNKTKTSNEQKNVISGCKLFQFHCCGVLSPSDYFDSFWATEHQDTLTVPLTCCHLLNSQVMASHHQHNKQKKEYILHVKVYKLCKQFVFMEFNVVQGMLKTIVFKYLFNSLK